MMNKLGTAGTTIPTEAWRLFYIARAICVTFFTFHATSCTDIVTVQEADIAQTVAHADCGKLKPTLADVTSQNMSRILFILVLLCVSKIRTKHLTAAFETNSKTFAIMLQAMGWKPSEAQKLTADQKRNAVLFIYNAFHGYDIATVLRHALPAVGCNASYNLNCLLRPLRTDDYIKL
eukprot:4954446-Amphidinium_carterae.1